MKYLLKKYWIHFLFILLITIPLFLICAIRTNKYIILRGGITPFNSIVEIDNSNKQEGSFSTVYVISLNKSTVFQNMLAQIDPTIETGEIQESSMHINDEETNKASKIQYDSSVETSIILAYKKAMESDDNIKIEYDFSGLMITYYNKNSKFRVSDIIKNINGIDVNLGYESFYNNLGNKLSVNKNYLIFKKGDNVTYYSNGELKNITIENDEYVAIYPRFNINYNNTFPKFKINTSKVGGPSGGLLQTLSIYNALTKNDLTHGLKIAGTGTISLDGSVGEIGGVREKIPTALDNNIDVFLCVSKNYDDAKEAYDSLSNRSKMKLVKINTFDDAINYLENLYV